MNRRVLLDLEGISSDFLTSAQKFTSFQAESTFSTVIFSSLLTGVCAFILEGVLSWENTQSFQVNLLFQTFLFGPNGDAGLESVSNGYFHKTLSYFYSGGA